MSAPNIRHLDDYLGTFYEDNTEKKVASAKNILILLLNLNNMETLINHCKSFIHPRIIASQSLPCSRLITHEKHRNVRVSTVYFLHSVELPATPWTFNSAQSWEELCGCAGIPDGSFWPPIQLVYWTLEAEWQPTIIKDRHLAEKIESADIKTRQIVFCNLEHFDEPERKSSDIEEDEEEWHNKDPDSNAREKWFPPAHQDTAIPQENVNLQWKQGGNGKQTQ